MPRRINREYQENQEHLSLTMLLRASTVDSRIPKHKTAKIQRHSIALKVVPFDTITKSENQYKTINTSKYILLGNQGRTLFCHS